MNVFFLVIFILRNYNFKLKFNKYMYNYVLYFKVFLVFIVRDEKKWYNLWIFRFEIKLEKWNNLV